jgi:hypothetical protein
MHGSLNVTFEASSLNNYLAQRVSSHVLLSTFSDDAQA